MPPRKPLPNALTSELAAAYLGVAKQRIYQMVDAGRFPQPDYFLGPKGKQALWLISTLDEGAKVLGWSRDLKAVREALAKSREAWDAGRPDRPYA